MAPVPILAFHGTNAEDFERFEFTEDVGFHFGGIETANRRLQQMLADCDEDGVEGARVLPCLLLIERPLRLPDCHTWSTQNVLGALWRAGLLTDRERDQLATDGYLDAEMFREIVENAGYDSVVYANETEGGGDSYIVLRAEHVRYALSELPAKPELPMEELTKRQRRSP